ncbi:MAG: DUF2283 domain-containing protein [Patescibacteria group bacterium]
MKIEYDKKLDAMYIKFLDGNYVESEEVSAGVIFDYDKKGKIMGIEILDASKKLSTKKSNQIFNTSKISLEPSYST